MEKTNFFSGLNRLINYYYKRQEVGLPVNIDSLSDKWYSKQEKKIIKLAISRDEINENK